jgi:hypothetical protein
VSPRARNRWLGWLVALLALALPAHAAGPVLHEHFPSDPGEDLKLNATTSDGRMPSAIETRSGVVKAPETSAKDPLDSEQAYGGKSTPNSADATYRIDKNTSRPEQVEYDDPFRPSITPFKRTFAYDMVDSALELGVANKELSAIPIGGRPPEREDQFYADLVVDLVEDAPVRIPTVGPDTRVLSATTSPPVSFGLLRDGADNWFIKGSERKRVHLTMLLAISRDTFGSRFASNVSWEALARVAPSPLPASVKPAAERVLTSLGVSRSMSPMAAASALIAHFRAFAPSDKRPTSNGVALYEELALSKKGVCRHRAYAFLITAHAIGLPTRMVRNEAHAWVEVYDGTIWHRVDLGGAAEQLDTRTNPDQPQYEPPTDPYDWPEGAESGQELANRTQAQSNAQQSTLGDGGLNVDGGASQPPNVSSPLDLADGGVPSLDDSRPPSRVSVTAKASKVQRGEALQVSGRIESDGEGCAGVRVDFALRSNTGRPIPIQSLSSNDDGRYEGAIVVPFNLEVGDYELIVSTDGNMTCGAGRSE